MSKPVGRYVLIKPVLEETIGSFILPINASQKSTLQGTVVEIGEIQDCEVGPGDTVLFANNKQFEDENGNWVVAYDQLCYVVSPVVSLIVDRQ